MIKVKKRKFLLLPGDGIGPEVIGEVKKIITWFNVNKSLDFDMEEALVGGASYDKHGTPITDEVFYKSLECEAVILGAVGGPKYDNLDFSKRPERALLKLRKELKLFANLRPAICFKQLVEASTLKPEIVSGLDIMIVRELTGGIYFGQKKEINDKGVASDLCEYSKEEILRVAHLAFKAAAKRKNKLTLIDKANVLASSRLWRSVVTELHRSKYKDVELDFLFVDNAAMQMVLNPAQFDVILTGNLFGDIISDEASVIGGSIGLLASASIGDRYALFEPIHGSFPQGKGKGIANPIATILSAAMMLDHFNMVTEANAIRDAVQKTINNNIGTPDISPDKSSTTSEVGSYISNIILQ